MGFNHPGIRHLYKLRFGAHFFNIRTACVTQSSTQTAHELVSSVGHWPLRCHTTFNALGHEVCYTGAGGFEITAARTWLTRHSPQAATPATRLTVATLETLSLPGPRFGPRH